MTSKATDQEIKIQQQYYSETAKQYDQMHIDDKGTDEHYLALSFLVSILDFYNIKSILDIGSGTGRAVEYIKNKRPDIHIVGVEPVDELREIGYNKGLLRNELVKGDATQLVFQNEEFDLVCEFGVLHHIKRPELAVSEMLRVAKKAVFISDSNNFGQGSYIARTIKQLINSAKLWKIADLIKTKGKGYTISEGDGLAYSYSVFNNYDLIAEKCHKIHLLNTKDGHINPYKTASHIVLLGIKQEN